MAVPTREHVVAFAADEQIAVRVTLQVVCIRGSHNVQPAGHRVVRERTVRAVPDGVGAVAGGEPVVDVDRDTLRSVLEGDEVAPVVRAGVRTTGAEVVVTGAAVQDVGPPIDDGFESDHQDIALAVKTVIARAAHQRVATVATADQVVSAEALDDIVTAQRVDDVRPLGPDDVVIAVRAHDRGSRTGIPSPFGRGGRAGGRNASDPISVATPTQFNTRMRSPESRSVCRDYTPDASAGAGCTDRAERCWCAHGSGSANAWPPGST